MEFDEWKIKFDKLVPQPGHPPLYAQFMVITRTMKGETGNKKVEMKLTNEDREMKHWIGLNKDEELIIMFADSSTVNKFADVVGKRPQDVSFEK